MVPAVLGMYGGLLMENSMGKQSEKEMDTGTSWSL